MIEQNNEKCSKNCIELRNVDKSFGDKRILKNVNLEIPYGAIYGLLGPSGCGKTTTVKMIAGISEASEGEVYVLGELMPQLKLMSHIGYMAQSDALYPVLTARDNLEFFGEIYGMNRAELPGRIQEVARIVNLEDDLDKAVAAYSGGMKRRLSLAAALLHEPQILVLDEPTVGIDPLLRADIWRELRKIAEAGTSILITTHVMDEAEKCDYLSMMRDGVLLMSGTPEEIVAAADGAETIEEAFIVLGRERENDAY